MLIKNFDDLLSHSSAELLNARRDALSILEEALKEMDAYKITKFSMKKDGTRLLIKGKEIDISAFEEIYVVGFGKASIGMALAIEEILPVKEGAVISTSCSHPDGRKPSTIKVFKGSHPLPSEDNIKATEELLRIVNKAGKNDLLIVLISGGGSSLLCKPRISLESMREVTDRLIKAGCTIDELNTVRKHLSYVKGGQLAKMSRAEILSLIISDVMGNPVEFIASGPTAPDSTTYMDAKNVLMKYGLWGKIEEVDEIINKGVKGKIEETPEEINNSTNIIIADNVMACEKAKEIAHRKGYYSEVVSTSICGEAREIGRDIASYAKLSPRMKAAFIFGGETTVNVKGKGKGGRNQELVLGAIREIEGERIVIVSCGTDGIDGNSDAAGAIGDGTSMERTKKMGMDADEYLMNNDSYNFFKKLGDLIITGETGTNVMDIQVVVKY